MEKTNIKSSYHKPTLSLQAFKEVSKKNFDGGNFQKLGHAREAFAKELGFDCYRAYTKEFNKYWNNLFNNVSRIIKHHKELINPIPLIIVIDTDIDYIDMIKKLYADDFNYFNNFSRENLFMNGRAFSEVNVYDICTKFEFDNTMSNLYKTNSKQFHLDKYGNEVDEWKESFKEYKNSRIDKLITEFQNNIKELKPDVAFFTVQAFSIMGGIFFAINNKLTEDDFIEMLTDKINGLPSKEEIKTLSENELLERASNISETLIRISRSKGNAVQTNESNRVMVKSTPSSFRDLEFENKRKKY